MAGWALGGNVPSHRIAPSPIRAKFTLQNVLIFVSVLVAGALATASGLGGSGTKSGIVLPIALGIGIILGLLGLTRFQIYVMVMLAIRSSLDISKLSGQTAGNTSVTASSRATDPSSILAVLFVILGILWLCAQYRAGVRVGPSNLRKALIAFWAAGVLSVFGSARPSASLVETLRIGAVVVMFMVLERMMGDPKRMRQILKATMASVIFPLLYTTFGFITLHPKSETKGSYTRIVGTFIQSNDYGRYLMLIIIMGAALYPYISRRRQRWLGVCMVLMCIFEFLTYTRSALIGAAIGLAIVGFKQSKRVLLGLLVVGFFGILLVPSLSGRFTDLTQYQAKQAAVAGTTASGDSFSWRLGYWTEVLPLANSNPITGIGLDMTQYITAEAKQPHNDFIRAYVETGIIGFICYLAMIIGLVNLGRRAVKVARKGTLEYGIAVGYLGCAAAFVLCSLVANVISNVVNLWYFVAFAAAANAVVTRSTSPGWYGDEVPVHTAPAIEA